MTETDALELARLATLVYLQHTGIILGDDINHNELAKCETKLTECQHKLLTASSWVTLFQERAETLQQELNTAHEENRKLVHAAKASGVKEVLAPQSVDLKTAVLPLPTVNVKEEVESPIPASNKTDGSVMLKREKKRAFHESSARRTLFNK